MAEENQEKKEIEEENKEEKKEEKVEVKKLKEEFIPKKPWYDRYYKILFIISIALLVISIIYIGIFYSQTGSLLNKDVTLTGGTSITVYTEIDISEIEEALSEFDISLRHLSELQTGKTIGFTIETPVDVDEIKPRLEEFLNFNLTEENSSIEFTGSALSESFFRELIYALIGAFILMAIVVFIAFRTIIPSAAVLLAAITDMIVPLAILNFLGFQISTAGIAAFLMLIAYSVDTDIMLTNRVLRKKEMQLNDRFKLALKTGLTMSIASIGAILAAYLITMNFSALLAEVFLILLLGLSVDLISTWFGNAAILKWYAEKKRI